MLHLRHCTRTSALRAALPLRAPRLPPAALLRRPHAGPATSIAPRLLPSACLFSTPSTPTPPTPPSGATPPGDSAPPRTTADEVADAEAGLNAPVQPAAAAAASAKEGAKQQQQQQSKEEQEAAEDAALDAAAASKKSDRGPVSWGSMAFLLLVGGGAVGYFRYQQDKQQNSVKVETMGTPMLGGSWSLIDDNGKRVTSEDYHGRYVLLYFGFTYCPDICPTELKKMEEALDLYDKMHPNHPITPIFISIDPKRDTPARLQAYKGDYDRRMHWLTGSDADVSAVAKKFRVYYSAPDIDDDEDYLVDHSIFFYLMDREGEFMEFFGKSRSAEEVAGRMSQLIAAENQK